MSNINDFIPNVFPPENASGNFRPGDLGDLLTRIFGPATGPTGYSDTYREFIDGLLRFNGDSAALSLYQLKLGLDTHPNDAQQENLSVTNITVSPSYTKSKSGTAFLTIQSDEAIASILTLQASSFVGGYVDTTTTITLAAGVKQRIQLPLAYSYQLTNCNIANTYDFYWDTIR